VNDESLKNSAARDGTARDGTARDRAASNEAAPEQTVPPEQSDPDEWDAVIAELGDIQSGLSYDDTQQALNRFLAQLNLTRRERQGLESSIGQLQAMVQRLEQSVGQIAVFGLVGRGKSSVLHALAGQA